MSLASSTSILPERKLRSACVTRVADQLPALVPGCSAVDPDPVQDSGFLI